MARTPLTVGLTVVGVAIGSQAHATPWAEVGDAQLRSDVELLAAEGLVDNITTQWPLPWGGLLDSLDHPSYGGADDYFVRAAVIRVDALGTRATEADRMNYQVTADFTNLPDVVRGFDALGRQDMQGQVSAEWMGETTAIRLQVGAQSLDRYDHQTLIFDGSYAAQRVGNAIVYAGYLTHWWGPGWTTALSLSNDARPFPQIGISRIDTAPFSSPWLSWIGPWQAEFFVGVLDGPRMARNTLFNGARVSASPLPGLEIALARTEESCGTNQPATATAPEIYHPCKPIAEFINVKNDPNHLSSSKDETNFDIRYTNTVDQLPFAIYTQFMDRDTGPFVHSDTSHLFGTSVWVPVRSTAVRITAEYADTISTENFLSFNKDFYGITYNDYKYTDGWEYRGRILGSSLGTDSRLATLQASWASPQGVTYTITYYRAEISSPNSPATANSLSGPPTIYNQAGANTVTSAPVMIDIGEARVRFPFDRFLVDLVGRFQDDQPRPDHGAIGALEAQLTYRL
jgi:hypothetical protein